MPDLPVPDLAVPGFAVTEAVWPLVVLGLRLAVVGALYLFLVAAFRALRAELRAGASAPVQEARSVDTSMGGGVNVPNAPAPAERESGRAWLEILRCDGSAELAGRRYPLEEITLVGRSVENTVVLADRRVSSRHARLEARNGDWWVEDLGSTNGTYVGGRRVDRAWRIEPPADLRFGPVVVRVTRETARP